jgi:FKBP-type peptidyl-prolyl cis-trans isomerase FkpA
MKSGLFAIALLFSAAIAAPELYAQSQSEPNGTVNPAAPQKVTSLVKLDTQIGTGDEAVYGSHVEVHYTGWLYDPKAINLHGLKFDSSLNAGAPFAFHLGARQVIKGWDLGVIGMKVGGKRTLIIPSYLGYSTAGSANIPPNTHLIFDIELLSVK